MSKDFVIRPATDRDSAALWPLFQDILREGATYAQDESTTEVEFRTYWTGRGGEQWVAEIDGAVVGGFTLRANHPGRGAHVGTASYLVSPLARGHGVGRRLGEVSLERARVLGFRAMQFNFVVSTNQTSVELWKKLGFAVVGTLPLAFLHKSLGPVDALVMFRTI